MTNVSHWFKKSLTIAAVSLAAMSTHALAQTQVLLKTSKGDITLTLDKQKAPNTVQNFVNYVKKGHYNGTIFHRVIDGFMIQGGGMDANMREKQTDAPIRNEANNGLKNDTYTIAMARTAQPHSATAQIFINVEDNSMLNYPSRDGWGYAVFGKVTQGTEVVDAIRKVRTTSRGMHADVPVEPVVITSATILNP